VGREETGDVIAEETAREVDLEVKRLMTEANQSAADILREHRHTLDAVVRLLLEHEVVDGDDVRRLLASEVRPTVRIKSA
jgi:cell division protease FtsH